MKPLTNFFKDETGLELSEYAVAAALIIIGVITAFTGLGNTIANKINEMVNIIKNGS